MTFVSVSAAAGSASLTQVNTNCTPAISNDGSTLYIAVNSGNDFGGPSDLLALNTITLATVGKAAAQ